MSLSSKSTTRTYHLQLQTRTSAACVIMEKAVFVILLVSLIISVGKADTTLPTAETQQGTYIGQRKVVEGVNVNYWYGIPYAQQPIGNLRWRPPEPLPKSKATNYAYIPNACPQNDGFGISLTESCLTLNVYAPENARHLPVYVWIHGGSFTVGAGIQYDAIPFIVTSIVNSIPIVIVTINYRLGFLGFLADRALYDESSGMNNRSTTGNYGILDQLMALGWIKKNIKDFGGNPKQITVGGQSAGGISITILLTSPLVGENTFQRAILQTGASWPNSVSNLEQAITRSGNILRNTVNCTTVQCLRNLTVNAVLLVQNIITSGNVFAVAAYPVIDGYVLNDTMTRNYAKGQFKNVPLLLGSNTNETALFTCPVFNGIANTLQVQAFFNLRYNATIVSGIPIVYGPISNYSSPLTYLNKVLTDSTYYCTARRVASQFASTEAPAYLYTYNYLIPATPPCVGVHHGAELVMFFPSVLPFFYPNYNLTSLEQQLSTNMSLYWASFIRTGNPNYAGSPAKWLPYRPSCDADFVLDINPRMRDRSHESICSTFWDPFAAA